MTTRGSPLSLFEKFDKTLKKIKKLSKLQKILFVFLVLVFSAFFINDIFELGILPTFDDITHTLLIDSTEKLPYETQVHIIDVGQGDCILLQQGNSYALIDAGERTQGEVVVQYLRQQGVEKLDYVIVSHMHTDHMGGMQAVIENFEVGVIILPDMSLVPTPTAPTVINFLTAVEKSNCEITVANSGNTYLLGSGQISIVTVGIKSDNQNNNSVGVLFQAEGLSFLNTGDGEREYEQNLLRTVSLPQVDIFNAGHHGSYTSNTPELIYTIMPNYITVSCSANNDYGHPHREPMQLFSEINATVLRTDQNGSIVFAVDDTGEILVFTERE